VSFSSRLFTGFLEGFSVKVVFAKIGKAYLKQFSNLQKTKLVCQIQLELIQSGNPISL
jgi:hypothetical protein